MRYQIVDVDTGRPVRVSWFSGETVVRCLYQRLAEFPRRDFRIVDFCGRPVPARSVVSRLRLMDGRAS